MKTAQEIDWLAVEEFYHDSHIDCLPSNAREWARFIEQVEFADEFVSAGYPSAMSGITADTPDDGTLDDIRREKLCLGYGYKKSVYEFLNDIDQKEGRRIFKDRLDNAARAWQHFELARVEWWQDLWGISPESVQLPEAVLHNRAIDVFSWHRLPKVIGKMNVRFPGDIVMPETSVGVLQANPETTAVFVKQAKRISADNTRVREVKSESPMQSMSLNSSMVESLRDISPANTIMLEDVPLRSLDGLLELAPKNIWVDEMPVPEEVLSAYTVKYTDSIRTKKKPSRTMKLTRKL